MESLTLLKHARAAGLAVSAEAGTLIVRGPASASSLAQQLCARKSEILGLLADEQSSRYPVILVWPPDTKGVAVIPGQWSRLETGEIEATYNSSEELSFALVLMLDAKRRDLRDQIMEALAEMGSCEASDEEHRQLEWHIQRLVTSHNTIVRHLRASKATAPELVIDDLGLTSQHTAVECDAVVIEIAELPKVKEEDGIRNVSTTWDGTGPIEAEAARC